MDNKKTRMGTPAWIDKVENEDIELSHATKESDYDEWKTALQFYENSLGTNEGYDMIKHGLKFIYHALSNEKSSGIKDLSIAFN